MHAGKHITKKLEPETIISSLEQGGSIASSLEHFEPRQSQLDLMRLVIRAFNEDSLAAAEAGTGVGKSFAYLLPAMCFALLNKERVVISTATITLQQQLYEKDIPLVASALPSILASLSGSGSAAITKQFKAVLVKGRGNYVCKRRLEEALKDPPHLFPSDNNELENLNAIHVWVEKAETGSKSELNFVPQESLWSRICSEVDLCMGSRCNCRETCFVMTLRRDAADADILVVNHHLLFADLAARSDSAGYESTVVLPPYTRIIIDEAHNIEEAATSFFSDEFSRIGVFRNLSRLYRKKRRGTARSGLLIRLEALLGSSIVSENRIADSIENIRKAMDDLDEAAVELCFHDGVFRLTHIKDEIINSRIKTNFIFVRKNINIFTSLVNEMLEQIPEEKSSPGVKISDTSNSIESLVWEIKSIIRYFENIANLCSSFMEYKENPDKVFWIEKNTGHQQGSAWARFSQTPLDIAHDLKESLFDVFKTVVCVSATLTIGQGQDSFNFWKNRSGLGLVEKKQALTGVFPSPFPYDTSVLLGVPMDAPLPTEPGYSTFVDSACTDLIEIAGGSSLVLFTSYTSLKSAYETAKPRLKEIGIPVFKQGDDDRSRLLKTFLEDSSSVLFATDSFWEGVDAPGDTLRLVILARLPFKTPNDPVFEARCEKLEQEGFNSFMDFSLPEAVMRFRQGFGRLMRRSSDRGMVVVLDSRLLKKSYGRIFLDSLPKTRSCFNELKNLLRNAEDFLY